MILVDTSVLIDYFNGAPTAEAIRLEALMDTSAPLVIGDLILMELLQGFRSDRDAALAQDALLMFEIIELGGIDRAISAARNYRRLRRLGITVRKPIDCLIATCCIEENLTLLHRDRDFDPFVTHMGLTVA